MRTSGTISVFPGSGRASASPEGSSAGSLDLHEGICDAPAPKVGCDRWPERLRLVGVDGQRVRGRCRATNLCRYCQRLYVVETVEMLTLDAMEWAPTMWLVLTAREHLTRKDTYGHLRQLRRALRRRWPSVEWFVQVEFQRRGALHLNLLIKGVPVEDVDELRDVAAATWCARVDAEPWAQWAEAMADGLGVVKYVSKMLAHGLKAEQAPPIGWKGHRTSQTRGYLVRPASEMRREAKASLRVKRELWRAEAEGLEGAEAIVVAELRAEVAAAAEWQLCVLSVDQETGELTGIRPVVGRDDVHAYRPPLTMTPHEQRKRIELADYDREQHWDPIVVPPRNTQLALLSRRRD